MLIVLQVYLGSSTLELENKVQCYLATRPEVEGLRVQSFVVSQKSFTLKRVP